MSQNSNDRCKCSYSVTAHSITYTLRQVCRPISKPKKGVEVNSEAEEEQSAGESDSDGVDKPARDIALRPRKRVSFNLDETPSLEEASQVRLLSHSSKIHHSMQHYWFTDRLTDMVTDTLTASVTDIDAVTHGYTTEQIQILALVKQGSITAIMLGCI